MNYILVGLGNPGEEYGRTRHNTGKLVVSEVSKKLPKKVKVVELDSFMNKSGQAVVKFVKNKKQAEKLIVVHDDLDLPSGTFKISFGRGSSGHHGVESIIKALKTRDFIRVRVGICPRRKPAGEKAVIAHILGNFKPAELASLKKLSRKIGEAIATLAQEGLPKAMSLYN